MGNADTKPKSLVNQIGPNFWNVRASFPVFKGLVDIGTQMSLVRLSTGKFLILSTVPLIPALKQELDALTDSGANIEAVVATHPFHTLAFPAFYQAYPKVPFYGTPRHVRRNKDIPWAGTVNDPTVMKKWESDGVFMRIPDGGEFAAPVPEEYNHWSSVWVYHKDSKTIHIDDTINYFSNPSMLMKVVGKKKGCMEFHDSLKGPALYPKAESPVLFKTWVENIIKDWEFENMCCAHIGNRLGGAKQALQDTLTNSQATLDRLSRNFSEHEKQGEDEDAKDCANYNVEGAECG